MAYRTARDIAQARRGQAVASRRILGVGDSVRTDLAAARNAGVDALFIASGIHRDELVADGAVQPVPLAALLRREGVTAVACATALAW